ncbi:MAG TPA: hypothetical protein VGL57_01185 [Solirubrobacteraceae bacterium]|jgi:hypothetical protein
MAARLKIEVSAVRVRLSPSRIGAPEALAWCACGQARETAGEDGIDIAGGASTVRLVTTGKGGAPATALSREKL